jgi:hypothetical protein
LFVSAEGGTSRESGSSGLTSNPSPPGSELIGRQIDNETQGSTSVATREQSVQSRTPILLNFLVRLPSVEATGRWRERGSLRRPNR